MKLCIIIYIYFIYIIPKWYLLWTIPNFHRSFGCFARPQHPVLHGLSLPDWIKADLTPTLPPTCHGSSNCRMFCPQICSNNTFCFFILPALRSWEERDTPVPVPSPYVAGCRAWGERGAAHAAGLAAMKWWSDCSCNNEIPPPLEISSFPGIPSLHRWSFLVASLMSNFMDCAPFSRVLVMPKEPRSFKAEVWDQTCLALPICAGLLSTQAGFGFPFRVLGGMMHLSWQSRNGWRSQQLGNPQDSTKFPLQRRLFGEETQVLGTHPKLVIGAARWWTPCPLCWWDTWAPGTWQLWV